MLGRDSINCWTVASPALELFQTSNRSLWIVDRRLLLLLARQDISKTSATAPTALSCQSVSEEPISHTERTPTQTRCSQNRCNSERRKRPRQQRGKWWGFRAQSVERGKGG